jgi:hypothetical protein
MLSLLNDSIQLLGTPVHVMLLNEGKLSAILFSQ